MEWFVGEQLSCRKAKDTRRNENVALRCAASSLIWMNQFMRLTILSGEWPWQLNTIDGDHQPLYKVAYRTE